jgi:hypothetical protein
MAPSPEIYFLYHLGKTDLYPIYEYYEYYTEAELFTIIEILYNHIADFDWEKKEVIKEEPKKEYNEHINNVLKLYSKGYYLDPSSGIIMEIPNEALKNLLQADIPSNTPVNVIEQLKTAIKMYYRFDSNNEDKKKAINILADILEPLRNDLKNLLNDKYDVNKNDHDKLIFEIVNNFNIRHNKKNQYTNYNKEIWYDWMAQYYTAVILTYYKLIFYKTF